MFQFLGPFKSKRSEKEARFCWARCLNQMAKAVVGLMGVGGGGGSMGEPYKIMQAGNAR